MAHAQWPKLSGAEGLLLSRRWQALLLVGPGWRFVGHAKRLSALMEFWSKRTRIDALYWVEKMHAVAGKMLGP